MKTSRDPRHQKRIKLMQDIFAWDFNHKSKDILISDILAHIKTVDQLIKKSAPERPIKDINKIDLAILRLSTFELIMKEVPIKVVVDEAVELAKEFGGDKSASFINGALGKIIEKEELNGQKNNTSNS